MKFVYPQEVQLAVASRCVVGREPESGFALPGKEVSRQHAEFRVDGPIFAVRDLGSRNGLFVNGQRVQDIALKLGDVVRCGEWIGVVVPEALAQGAFGEVGPSWYGGVALANAVEPARRLAGKLPILIQGETGTGKEGVARAIHKWSGRSGPLVPINCATLPAELAEAELFGYRKGAFSGADAANPGLFRTADGGTLFLDEVLELPLPLQAKLLRVLQEGKVRGIGETRDVSVDVAVLAATQEPLVAAVAERRFRADLHARLDGVTVVLPPLRQRREDIPLLFKQFVRLHHSGPEFTFEVRLVETLCLYDWPLNVRELELVTRRTVGLFAQESELKRRHLPERLLQPADAPRPSDGPEGASVYAAPVAQKRVWRKTDDKAEFQALVDALKAAEGSVAKAAQALGISRARAYRILDAHPDFALDPGK